MKVNCPQCKKSVDWVPKSLYRPFCSKRCQLIDLGQWADEEHKINASSSVDSLNSDASTMSKQPLSPEDIENIEELLNNLSKNSPYNS